MLLSNSIYCVVILHINGRQKMLKTIKTAFPNTLPVMAGYIFLGMAYGILMNTSGFSTLLAVAMSVVVFGGSLQFVAVEVLLSPFAPLATFIMALLVQARHIFYGISMLEKYKNTGLKKLYLIFGLTDETFSVNYASHIPEDVDKGIFYFLVTLMDQSYWVIGTFLGCMIGKVLPFSTDGISFSMTAMFVVIFIEQCEKKKNIPSAVIGVIASFVCLLIFGPDSFLVPSMLIISAVLLAIRKPLEKRGVLEDDS